jgi:hypothetical protein
VKAASLNVWGIALVALSACDESVAAKSGLTSRLRVIGGQYIAEDFPASQSEDASTVTETTEDGGVVGAPQVDSIQSPNNRVAIGVNTKAISALVSPHARTVAIALEGEPGYWRVPVGQPSLEAAPDLDVGANLSFDRGLKPGTHKVWLAAADEHGEYGDGKRLAVDLIDGPPEEALALSLSWSADMDLDLIVRLPDGSLLTPKGLADASGKPVAAGADVPSIDLDSNIGCLIDGRRRENAVLSAPDAGEYEVYVRLAGACGIPYAGWNVQVFRNGKTKTTVSGVTYAWEADVTGGGPEGSGRFALRFNVSE